MQVRTFTHTHASAVIPPFRSLLLSTLIRSSFSACRCTECVTIRGSSRIPNGERRRAADNFGDANRPERDSYRSLATLHRIEFPSDHPPFCEGHFSAFPSPRVFRSSVEKTGGHRNADEHGYSIESIKLHVHLGNFSAQERCPPFLLFASEKSRAVLPSI